MVGGKPRTPVEGEKVEVYCWCGRVKMWAPMQHVRQGTPHYCGISCSTYPPMAKLDQAPKGRPRKYDSNGNKL